ncbi:MAG: ketol-acid reductoisomerase [Maribacter dokdonensis]|mgnify:FL=1|jgi:ketol-acid reductoisomerase|uniref:Ketol-acid reductoisomerase (NADP(+)) n=3 Tax=Maribacter dokdonensis TaxID=320912 RepID=A0A1H4R2J9_9FLAO|nr:ketol-acid reductoisomerase [Maribacter dokdonensis]MBU2901720.1 ketol-acid reductoisomerase [Maribacter dokdonensis]MDP2527240.1 ketol-acid reductoisomerase [Maribacter dokdonensis]CAG2535240.1 ketol-acid reductoisomerase [Maribacter dokdonensis]SEC26103.1 ketol-acid reductoisomerase [Maribacter dokdonensis]
MANYFNTLSLRDQLTQLGKCRFMDSSEFADGVNALKGKKIVIVGCGAQGLNQGLNMRDSGLDIAYTLRDAAIKEKRQSFINATENGFTVGTYEELIPTADVVINLTPDKQHTAVVGAVMPLMKKGATLSYSHGFNIVEEGTQVRKDLTVIMVAPKSPGSEVREEYKRGFGVPTLIAVHPENDPEGKGLAQAKAYAAGTGGHRAGVLESSFVAEVKSDLMGEQTILCGLLQTGSILCFDKMVEKGIDAGYASKLIQYGWETITEGMKYGGITHMMDRLSNPAKIKAFELSEELKDIMRPLFQKHMDDIMTGHFSKTMMEDWANDDKNLLTWRAATGETAFEKTPAGSQEITEQEFYDNGVLMVAMVRAGVELAFEAMTESGIIAESAYYESLHETPLIANTIARKKLFEMNRVISDTAEYGCYLFDHACKPLLTDFMKNIDTDVIGKNFSADIDNDVDNAQLIAVNKALREHPVEIVGARLRESMTAMKPIV